MNADPDPQLWFEFCICVLTLNGLGCNLLRIVLGSSRFDGGFVLFWIMTTIVLIYRYVDGENTSYFSVSCLFK